MGNPLPATLNPALNPTGLTAAISAIYAAAVAIINAATGHTAVSAPVIITGIAALISLLTRTIVTPVAAPKDGNGNPLIAAPAVTVLPPVPVTGTVTVLPAPISGTSGIASPPATGTTGPAVSSA